MVTHPDKNPVQQGLTSVFLFGASRTIICFDFQNPLSSRIFGVFTSGFLHRTTLTSIKNPFSHVLVNFNF